MFQGYSNETIEFFLAIRFNNNRPFSCDEDDIILLRECAGGVDGALAVFDDEGAAQFFLGKPRRHVA